MSSERRIRIDDDGSVIYPNLNGNMPNPTQAQVGGTHYEVMKIQPIDYIVANKLNFMEGCAIKYLTRHPYKGGAEDIKKAIHYCKMILKYEYNITE